jgi:hypothetical protein
MPTREVLVQYEPFGPNAETDEIQSVTEKVEADSKKFALHRAEENVAARAADGVKRIIRSAVVL